MRKLIDDILALVKAPLNGELDAMHVFIITGVVIVAAIVWFIILDHIRLAAQEI